MEKASRSAGPLLLYNYDFRFLTSVVWRFHAQQRLLRSDVVVLPNMARTAEDPQFL